MENIETTVEAVDYLLGKKEVGKTVAIIGGGLTGCEIAYDLHRQGKKPVIVEMLDDLICTPNLCLANSSFLRDYFDYKKTPVYLETTVKEITREGLIAIDKEGKQFEVKGSKVIMSVGYNPVPLWEEGKNIHLVGDCNGIGNLRTVIWRAWDVAMKI